MTAARTCAGLAAPAWTCAGWPGGRLDGYVEDFLQPWDYAAGLLVVEEAGGRVTAPDGAPLSLTRGGGVLASNGHLHAALQSQLE